jgi:hypothetical protein
MSEFKSKIPKPNEGVVNTPDEVKAYYKDAQEARWAEEDRQPDKGDY